mgnify:CR=1 FL=1
MKKITERIKKESQKIQSGDFSGWYEGLSPIEKVVYGQTLRLKNILFPL